MKKSILAIGFVFFLTACSKSNTDDFNPNSMSGMPCHKMGDSYMGNCQFDENGNVIIPENTGEKSPGMMDSGENFSQDTKDLPEAKTSEIVELKNGDVFKMTAGYVKQEIGNQTIRRLAYNGQIPGPLIKVEKNAEISLEFKNDLNLETTLHSHGVRLDNAFDGTPEVTQKAIKPGESFTYKIKFPDEGIYWYHPHVREDYAQELGLYGNYSVEPEREDYWTKVDREEFLMLDDILINENEPSFKKEYTDHSLMGRFGNIPLINNKENFTLKSKRGEVIRFYITNVANTRTFNLQMPGIKLKLVGGDSGRIEKENFVDSILIGPSERYVIEAYFPDEGIFEINHKTPEKIYHLGQVSVEEELKEKTIPSFSTLRKNNDYEAIRSEIDSWLKKPIDKSLRLSIDMKGMNMDMGMMKHTSNGDGIEWEDEMQMMNQMSTSDTVKWKLIDEETSQENMDINWKFKKGEIVKIKIFNDPNSVHPMQHPIHFHGQRFLVLTRDGMVNDNFQWKDTALIKKGETVELLVEMSNPGKWMTHCHIAEHLHSGMMMGFEVTE